MAYGQGTFFVHLCSFQLHEFDPLSKSCHHRGAEIKLLCRKISKLFLQVATAARLIGNRKKVIQSKCDQVCFASADATTTSYGVTQKFCIQF